MDQLGPSQRFASVVNESNYSHTQAERRSDFADFFAAFFAAFLPLTDISISFCPLGALRRFVCFGAFSVLMLCFNASIRSTTFAPLGRGLWAIVLPWRFALISSVQSLYATELELNHFGDILVPPRATIA